MSPSYGSSSLTSIPLLSALIDSPRLKLVADIPYFSNPAQAWCHPFPDFYRHKSHFSLNANDGSFRNALRLLQFSIGFISALRLRSRFSPEIRKRRSFSSQATLSAFSIDFTSPRRLRSRFSLEIRKRRSPPRVLLTLRRIGSPYSPANLFLLLLPRRRRRRSPPRVPTTSSSPVSVASDELYPGVCSFCPLRVKPTTAVLPKPNLFSGASDLFSAASSYQELHSSLAIRGLERIPWFIHHFPECTIAHALEKTKYPNSDIYWKKFEDQYYFSCQFTADLIAMNHADFIITSTFQEIAGRACIEGVLTDKSKPIIFSMARLDRVKNITGLVEFYGKNPRLRGLVNLVVIAGDHAKASKDVEEQAEMKKMDGFIEQYKLDGHIRWISAQMNRVRNGELYCCIANKRGVFVQGDKAAELLVNFFEKCKEDTTHWEKISKGAIKRIEEKYTWKFYYERLMTLSGVYGFWKNVSNLGRRETKRYLEMFYALKYRNLAQSVPIHSDGEVAVNGAK
ncbi:hypothetical protein KSP40_PGU015701 [Platanthera guangdongensis]|uniref:sucrose synthase n=1 Tax=Platanthera guangdongensis TaxID=2320717 RepID=A0ABR2LVQ2_9ASPA